MIFSPWIGRTVLSTTLLLCWTLDIAGQVEPNGPTRSSLPRWRDHSAMVFVRGGEFTIAGNHHVRVRSFYMDQYEVTNEQYCAFLNDGHSQHFNENQEIEKVGELFKPKCCKDRWPVYAVSWDDAAAYARWAGKRLPTEAEWQWAAGGSDSRRFPWGNEAISPERTNYGGNVGHPQPVGAYPDGRTPSGIFDLSGNVAEWCRDWYQKDYFSQAPRDSPTGPERGERRVRRGGCWAMAADDQTVAARGSSAPSYRPKCIGFRCVRPARRVLVLLGENFEEIELAGYTGVLSWAAHTTKAGNYMIPKDAPIAEVPTIEVVIAGFAPEVHGMGGMNIRPHVLVKDLSEANIDKFDAVAIPACVGGGRGQHTWSGQADLESDRAVGIVRRIHANGGMISTMCAGAMTPRKANLALPQQTEGPVAFDEKLRTATSIGPGVAMEAACLLVQRLVSDEEYRCFRKYNPWLFGDKGQYSPRLDSLK